MNINIKMITVKSIAIEVQPTDTISSVKMKIQHSEGMPFEHIKLYFNGVALENEKCLSDYNVLQNSNVQCQIDLRQTYS